MSNYVRHTSEDSGRGPSVAIWGDLSKIQHDQLMGYCSVHFDDFARAPNTALVNAAAQSGLVTYTDNGVTIKGIAGPADLNTSSNTHALGVLEIAHDGTDLDEGHVQIGDGGQYQISLNTGKAGKLFFETRLSINSVADNGLAIFAGLGTAPVAAGHLVDNTGALEDNNFVGFQILADDGDKIDIAFKANGQTQNTVLANAHTMVADKYVKLGFVFDPTAKAAEKIKFYINGTEQSSYVSAGDINAATFPEGVALAPMVLTKLGSATDIHAKVDWIGVAQYADGIQ